MECPRLKSGGFSFKGDRSLDIDSEKLAFEIALVLMKAQGLIVKNRAAIGTSYPLRANDFIEMISQETGYAINVIEDRWGTYRIRGALHRYENVAEIYIACHKDVDVDDGITTCEQRFISLKEAAHILIDEDDSYMVDHKILVDGILFNHSGSIKMLASEPKDSRSEIYAKIVAMELLFPMSERDRCKEALDSGKRPAIDIAMEFKIPEKEVIRVLRDADHDFLKSCHALLDRLIDNFGKKYD